MAARTRYTVDGIPMEFPWLAAPTRKIVGVAAGDLAVGDAPVFKPRPAEIVEQADWRVLQKAKEAHSLTDLFKAGFALFTPAIIVRAGLLRTDPVVEFVRRFPQFAYNGLLQQIDTQQPMFLGLGKVPVEGQGELYWDHRVYAAEKQLWPDALDFFSMLTFHHPRTKAFYRTGFYFIEAPDVTDTKLRRVMPKVPVCVFCVIGQKKVLYLAPGKRMWDPLRLASAPAPFDLREERKFLLKQL